MPTRAQQLGIKPARMAAKAKKVIAKHRTAMHAVIAPWSDIDNGVEGELDKLLDAYDAFAKALDDSAEWLNDEAGS